LNEVSESPIGITSRHIGVVAVELHPPIAVPELMLQIPPEIVGMIVGYPGFFGENELVAMLDHPVG